MWPAYCLLCVSYISLSRGQSVGANKVVDTRRKRQILTCIWRNISKGVIDIVTPVRESRQNAAPTIYLPVPNTKVFNKSVYYQGATLWNSLLSETRLCENINEFKTQVV